MVMIATGQSSGISPKPRSIVHNDARVELIRHSIDLRVDACIMLGTALFAACCAFLILGASNDDRSDDIARAVAPSDTLSFSACIIFVAVALVCLTWAYRFWRRATTIRSRMATSPITAKTDRHLVPVTRPLVSILGGASGPVQAL